MNNTSISSGSCRGSKIMTSLKSQDLHEYFSFSSPDQRLYINVKNNNESCQSPSKHSPEIPPPTLSNADLDLLKHFKLYIQLKQLFENSEHNNNNKSINFGTKSISTTCSFRQNGDLILKSPDCYATNGSLRHNKFTNKTDDIRENNLYIEDYYESESDGLKDESLNVDSSNLLEDEYGLNDDENCADEFDSDDLFFESENESNNDFYMKNLNDSINENGMLEQQNLEKKLRPRIPYNFYSDSYCSFLNDESFIGRDWLFKEIEKVIHFYFLKVFLYIFVLNT
jgi:hypothetical protein